MATKKKPTTKKPAANKKPATKKKPAKKKPAKKPAKKKAVKKAAKPAKRAIGKQTTISRGKAKASVIWIDKEAEAINDYLLSVADEALAQPDKKSTKKRSRV